MSEVRFNLTYPDQTSVRELGNIYQVQDLILRDLWMAYQLANEEKYYDQWESVRDTRFTLEYDQIEKYFVVRVGSLVGQSVLFETIAGDYIISIVMVETTNPKSKTSVPYRRYI